MTSKERKRFCPVCKKESAWDGNPFRPFCTERCRVIDLGKWASEEYRIAGEHRDPEHAENDEINQTEK